MVSFVTSAVKRVKARPCFSLPTATTFKEQLYCQPLPGLHRSHVTATCAWHVPPPPCPGLTPGFPAELGPVASQCPCREIAGLHLALATVSGPDPDLDLPLCILAPYGEVTVLEHHSWLAFPWDAASPCCSTTLLCAICRITVEALL